jgi:hypothetical protein
VELDTQTEPPASLATQLELVGAAHTNSGQATATFAQPAACHFCSIAFSTLASFAYSLQRPQGESPEATS